MAKNKHGPKLHIVWEYLETPHTLELLRQAIEAIMHDSPGPQNNTAFDKRSQVELNEEAIVEGNPKPLIN